MSKDFSLNIATYHRRGLNIYVRKVANFVIG